jgi:hypothetical protein
MTNKYKSELALIRDCTDEKKLENFAIYIELNLRHDDNQKIAVRHIYR